MYTTAPLPTPTPLYNSPHAHTSAVLSPVAARFATGDPMQTALIVIMEATRGR